MKRSEFITGTKGLRYNDGVRSDRVAAAHWQSYALGLVALIMSGCGTEAPMPGPNRSTVENLRQIAPESELELPIDESQDEKTKDDRQSEDATGKKPSPPGSATLTANEAFERTAHKILVERCGSCHATTAAPLFAQKNLEAASIAVTDTGKVNFTAIDRSRLYLRLAADNHNCWSDCATNAEEIKLALTEWLDLLLKINPDFLSEFESPLVTNDLLFSDAAQRTPTPDPLSIIIEAETATVTAPMIIANDLMSSGGRFIEVPAGTNGGTINNANQNGIGTSVFNFMVPTAGKYKVWAQANAVTDANNAFFIRMDAGPFQNWAVPVTAGKWEWSAANQQDGQAELSFDLTAGTHTLEIKRRDVATKLDRLAITMNPLFDGTQAETQPVQVLRYDISAIARKPNTYFEIEVMDFSEEAFKFRKPTIISEQPLTVKGLRILINGHYNPQHNTYNLIESTVMPPRTELSRSGMVVLKEKGKDLDKISFSFEALQ